MTGRKRKQASKPVRNVRTRSENPRWDENEPENWSVTELIRRLRDASFLVPASLKKSQLIQIYRDNVVNSNQSRNRTITSEEEIDSNEIQNGDVLPILPATSSVVIESEAGRMSTEAKVDSLSHAVENIQQSLVSLTNAVSSIKAHNGNRNQAMTYGTTTDLNTRVSSDSVPFIETVSTTLRNNIIQGKDVNLATLLLPRENEEHKIQDNEGQVILIKPNHDVRLQRNLSISEFILAFSKFKNVMCEVYPERRQDLDAYERDIVEMASMTRGPAFYDYHKAFSARASALLHQRNIRVDWSVRDTKLFTSIFAGQTVIRCDSCNSLTHTAHFCPKAKLHSAQNNPMQSKYRGSTNQVDVQGRPRLTHKGKEICNNFNGENGCNRQSYNLVHICSACKLGKHASIQCKTAVRQKDGNTTEKQ